MSKLVSFKINLQPPVDDDVVSRLITIVVQDGNSSHRVLYEGTVAPYAVALGPFSAPEESTVTVTLIDVDDAGNRSEAVEVSAVMPDLSAPVSPVPPEIVILGAARDSDETEVEDVTANVLVEDHVEDHHLDDEAVDDGTEVHDEEVIEVSEDDALDETDSEVHEEHTKEVEDLEVDETDGEEE